MNPLYNFGISVYSLGARLAGVKNRKAAAMVAGQAETLERIRRRRESQAPEGFDLWVHSASLGEFEQARPMIDLLVAENPEINILASFFSPSGYEVRKDYHPRVLSVYLPFDRPNAVRDFIDAASPRKVVFVKYEFWGNFLSELHKRNIPTYLISSIFRPGQIFFRRWGGQFLNVLKCFSHIFVQDDASLNLLAAHGIENVTVAGDTRFDRVAQVREKGRTLPEVAHFVAQVPNVIVFGSSWETDEKLYIPLLLQTDNIKAIIAPHEFNAERIFILRTLLGEDKTMTLSDYSRLFSADPNLPQLKDIKFLIVDSFGLLSSLYRYGTVAYVGGGFGKSIHNINEAAAYGIPVVFGPENRKFKEASDLKACGGGFEVSESTLASTLGSLLNDSEKRVSAGKAAKDYIDRNVGATDRVLSFIGRFKDKS